MEDLNERIVTNEQTAKFHAAICWQQVAAKQFSVTSQQEVLSENCFCTHKIAVSSQFTRTTLIGVKNLFKKETFTVNSSPIL